MCVYACCVCIKRIYFKELTHTIIEAAKSKIYGVGQLELKSKASAAEFPLAPGRLVFCSIQAITQLDSTRPRRGGHSSVSEVHRFQC